jgi:N-acylglucosamine-6-phosphate 2-epimerase
MKKFTEIFPRGLIVSCQAREGEPLLGSDIMACMARAAYLGGAIGIRANTPQDISAIKQAVPIPILGIYKIYTIDIDVFITPTFESAKAIADAGADAVALDGTERLRPDNETLQSLIKRIHKELDLPVMADCSTIEEGIKAVAAGADVVASTLAGYTPYSDKTEGPDFRILEGLIKTVEVPVIAEGRFHTPDQAVKALEMGAYTVVVGTAITRPHKITARFSSRINAFINSESDKIN